MATSTIWWYLWCHWWYDLKSKLLHATENAATTLQICCRSCCTCKIYSSILEAHAYFPHLPKRKFSKFSEKYTMIHKTTNIIWWYLWCHWWLDLKSKSPYAAENAANMLLQICCYKYAADHAADMRFIHIRGMYIFPRLPKREISRKS